MGVNTHAVKGVERILSYFIMICADLLLNSTTVTKDAEDCKLQAEIFQESHRNSSIQWWTIDFFSQTKKV